MEFKDLKDLFVRVFPNEGEFRKYLRWREHRQKELKRRKRIRKQMEERQREILGIADDPDDVDFDAMTADIWRKVTEN